MFKINFRRPPVKIIFHPRRVWRWLLSLFLILVFGVLFGGYFLYQQLTNLGLISQRRLRQQTLEPSRLDLPALAKVSAQLDQKAARTAALKLKPTPITDPALKSK